MWTVKFGWRVDVRRISVGLDMRVLSGIRDLLIQINGTKRPMMCPEPELPNVCVPFEFEQALAKT